MDSKCIVLECNGVGVEECKGACSQVCRYLHKSIERVSYRLRNAVDTAQIELLERERAALYDCSLWAAEARRLSDERVALARAASANHRCQAKDED